MNSNVTRRKLLQAAGLAALPAAVVGQTQIPGPRAEGRDTPKICLQVGDGGLAAGAIAAAGMRRVKQLGVDHVLTGGPRIPWEESRIKSIMEDLKSGGLSLGQYDDLRISEHALWKAGTRRGD